TLLVAGVAIISGQWWTIRGQMRDAGGLFREIAEQRATIDGFNRRIADLQKEVAGWRDLHARIWEPFGPDSAPKGRSTGIGGAGVTLPDQQGGRTTPADDLDRLGEAVTEQGQSLRALERLISRAGKALASLPSRWPVRGAVNSEFGN